MLTNLMVTAFYFGKLAQQVKALEQGQEDMKRDQRSHAADIGRLSRDVSHLQGVSESHGD